MTLNKSTSPAYYLGVFFICISASFVSCQSEKKEAGKEEHNKVEIILKNSSSKALKEKAVTIQRNLFNEVALKNSFPLLLGEKGDTIPVQIDDVDNNNQWDELFFLMDFEANEELKVELKWINEPLETEKRVNVRFGVRASLDSKVEAATSDTFYAYELPGVMGYQPYQTDGPSWENDKVGFRHYLDGRNSKDVFGKKTSLMSPDNVGINKEGVTEDNYHVMDDWGRDILSVGNSVGIGGFGLKIKDSLARIGVTEADSLNNVDETKFNILADGPIRALMQYEYKNWQPESYDRVYNVNELSAIWPGIYAFKNQVKFQGLKGDETAVVGLVNSNTENPLSLFEVGDYVVLFTHDKQTYEKEWYLGLALIIPKESYLGFFEAPKEGRFSQSFVAELQIENNKAIEYYAVAAWELSDPGFANRDYFKNYISDLADQLNAEIIISIN